MTLRGDDPVAAQANMVCFGKVRFQFLTDRFVRLEWAADGRFEDRPTLAVVNRRLPAVRFRESRRGRKLTLRTDGLRIDYTDDGRRLSKANLRAEFEVGGKKTVWYPGKRDAKNLKGTARTLDAVRGDAVTLHDGLVSRSGWACVDESDLPVLEPHERFGWWPVARPEGERQDLYLLACGLNYKQALAAAAPVFGRLPLPPRYVFGYWFSRAWCYTDWELEDLAVDFDRLRLPLDVLVIDMDWHLDGWTGYTWDRAHFTDPKGFLRWLKARDLKVTLNLHPADGIVPFEEQYDASCKALGRDPATREAIPFDATDPEFMAVYFDLLHRPHERLGVDFWWIDWQQGKTSTVRNLDPLPWLNYLHYHDLQESHRPRRPLILSRFGGLGSGRYPLGFSGDTFSIWESLAFQPYFTSTAANALYGYWSHDIGGHNPGPIDRELYLRWLQCGVYLPILRTHCTKSRLAERRVWKYPTPYAEIMIRAIRRRYELVPYIYTENRKAFDTGLALCRPMYHEHPRMAAAYRCPRQYYFGAQMIAAPVLGPLSEKTGLAAADVWLPPGQWYDAALGRMLTGGRRHTQTYALSETPVFVRAGAVIPEQPAVCRLVAGSYRDLVVVAYPGGDGAYELYEDDGVTNAYLEGKSARLPIRQKAARRTRRIRVGPSKGAFKGFRKRRSLEVRLPGVRPPASVCVNGKELPFTFRPSGKSAWRFDGDTGTLIVQAGTVNVTRAVGVLVSWDGAGDGLPALKGIMTRLANAHAYVTDILGHWSKRKEGWLVTQLAQTGNRLSRWPDRHDQEIAELLRQLPAARRAFKAINCDGQEWAEQLQRQGVGTLSDALRLIARKHAPGAEPRRRTGEPGRLT